jgi:PDZ domain-containing protein
MTSPTPIPNRKLGRKIAGVCTALVLAFGAVVPLPYYVEYPGSADPLQPLITVNGGHKTEKGTFMLTSVSQLKARNVYYLLYGLAQRHSQVMKQDEVEPGMDDASYHVMQQFLMDSAKQNAMAAALNYLGKDVTVHYTGVEVLSILPNTDASRVLRVGDVIQAVGYQPIQTGEQLIQALKKKKPGDPVTIQVERNGEVMEQTLRLMDMQKINPKGVTSYNKAGLGILHGTRIRVESPVQIQIKTDQNLGGPSAGFMFALEMINQLSDHDMTKGYRIAGTGTIDPSGQIGQIGGVEYKILAADREHADLFFVPKDVKKGETNEKDAIAQAKSIGTQMKVVPVRSLAEAIAYLNQLPEKR